MGPVPTQLIALFWYMDNQSGWGICNMDIGCTAPIHPLSSPLCKQPSVVNGAALVKTLYQSPLKGEEAQGPESTFL